MGGGVRTPAEAKVLSVKEFPQPKTKTDIRAFLGLTGYYSRYIERYADIAAPLTEQLKGKRRKGPLVWDDKCERAFQGLKNSLSTFPVLHAPNFEQEFILQCDASNVALGLILAQEFGNEEHPILYISRKFSPSERKYSAIERECLALVHAVKKLHCYLDGRKFHVITDHQPLVWLQKNQYANARLTRWSLILQGYDFTVSHKAGKKIRTWTLYHGLLNEDRSDGVKKAKPARCK